MTDSANSTAQQDESAVAAVRGGDAERYRELVERHERRVYAVAWSRLGDAALAEEATQEAFIRAYRRLWLLGDGAKFSGWVNTIARRLAINAGLRHRRELNKRERWALENPDNSSTENSANESDPLHTPETLRQTLAELPAAHRECLVLFYLEGKSGAEAAAALGISEAALRVRLHRARAAMRERLEEKLEGSLANLRPTKTLVTAIMAGVLASSSAKAATAGGIGATILGTLAKFTPFKWLFAFFWLIIPAVAIVPPLLLQRWRLREERKNFRDAEGFRSQLYGQIVDERAGMGIVFFIFLMLALFIFSLFFVDKYFAGKTLFLFLGSIWIIGGAFEVRQFQINRSWIQIRSFVVGLVMSSVFIIVGLGWLPINAIFPIIILSSFLGTFDNRRTSRMDYNLFLRASQGMFPETNSSARGENSLHLDRVALRAFAQFLTERWLVRRFKWREDGLSLGLSPIKSSFTQSLAASLASFAKHGSYILLRWDGSVEAHCSETNLKDLPAMRAESVSQLQLEEQVTAALLTAWENFRDGNFKTAERALGQTPDAEIFVKPPSHLGPLRFTRIMLAVCLALIVLPHFFQAQLSGMKPINLTEAQVHEFMSLVSTNPNPMIKTGDGSYTQNGFAFDPRNALLGFACFVLPETNLFTPRGLDAIHSTILGTSDLDAWRQNPKRLQLFMNSQFHRAIYEGWISWPELNLQPADCEAFLHTNRSSIYEGALMGLGTNWKFFLNPCDAWSWVKSQHYDVMRIQDWGLWDLRFLSEINSLDLVDRDALIQQIADVQTLSANPPNNPPIHDWRDVRGLFFTPCFPALQDTYRSLAALEILGGLNKIDREACITGILKRHEGKGYFTSPDSGVYNEYHIDGSARDTIAAFESLRILGALDRVKDLDKWQFRVASYNASKPDANGVRVLTWDEIEAWVCQQRLEKILQARKEHPAAPVHSLLESF